MDYIQYLRSMVGTKPVIMVTAVVILTNAEGELLMQRRADGSGWGFIGSFMELGETVEEAARREVFEETDLTVGELELFGVFSTNTLQTFSNGDQVQVVHISYLTDRVNGTLQLSAERLELRYFALGALPEPLFAPNVPILEVVQERFGKR
jgi:ADP-ribose pyrophosphatase YjhB (NUDIX family)